MLIRGMREGGVSKIFSCYPRDSGTCHQFFFVQGVINWIVGSSINVLTDLILFRYQTTIKYTINFNY